MAYPQEGSELPDLSMDSGIKSKIKYNLEGLIPVILILIIAFFLAARFGVITCSTPILGPVACALPGLAPNPASVLIIGTPTTATMKVLNESKDLANPVTIKTETALEHNPEAYLANYDIVILDQEAQASKEVSRQLGEAIQNYVSKGGKLIVVKNSGIFRPAAADVLGWTANFGNIVPVECTTQGMSNTPSCLDSAAVPVRGKLYPGANGFNHPIMQGYQDGVPSMPGTTLSVMNIFDVTLAPGAQEVAYLQDERNNAYYPAIVESPQLVGKSLYFNYDPGATPGIFQATLDYLH
ncbi:MAG: hypothetical protein V1847_05370 [Candidatus Diapherotrites archaeon]